MIYSDKPRATCTRTTQGVDENKKNYTDPTAAPSNENEIRSVKRGHRLEQVSRRTGGLVGEIYGLLEVQTSSFGTG
jgi:hypothetical protein